MAVVLVTVATAALKPVLEKLATLAGEKYKRFKNVHKEIPSLSAELRAIDAFLLEMSEEENPSEQDRVWINEVRDLSYDIEDSIDDFMKHIEDQGIKPESFMGKLQDLKKIFGKIKPRSKIGNDIHDLNTKVVEVSKRNKRYKARETFSNTQNSPIYQDRRALVIFEDASKLVGIDEPKAELMNLLAKEDGCEQQPKILSIVGPGGMGKTTIAYQVYREFEKNRIYECQAFVSVSRNPNMNEVLRTLLSKLTKKDKTSIEGTDDELISNINSFLLNRSLLENKWHPPPRLLQKLDYHFSPIKEVPVWVGSLDNLKQLNLQLMRVWQKDLCLIGRLPILRMLSLQTREGSGDRLRVSGETGFPRLIRFSYVMPCAGMELMFAPGCMPMLVEIIFGFHAAFTQYVLQTSGGSFDFGIHNLPRLTRVVCHAYGREKEIVAASKAAMEKAERTMERATSTHPNHPTISFTKIMPPFYKEEAGPSAQSQASTS